ncbi:MAG TPA: alpha/beta hydrolase-fold protein [Kofleriaceae bacterium]|nr:alpha/beta hydrolase-fold protein [Kofleriaceae bacterium]
MSAYQRIAHKTAVCPSLGLLAACLSVACLAGCLSAPAEEQSDAPSRSSGKADGSQPASGPCPASPAGLDCLFALHDEVRATCDQDRFDDLYESLEARVGELPPWHGGRALFVSIGAPVAPAGDWNGWSPDQATDSVCGTELFTAVIDVPSGRHEYKLVGDDGWQLDPFNWAFAYDEFAGNPDGRNSVLDTHDSGLGHLVQPPDPLCSAALGNCRAMIAYLPPGYGAPINAERRYPTVFLHDAQNVFDDSTCCFGHGGWEINRTLDREIDDGTTAEVIAVAAEHGGAQRLAEYGGELTDEFMDFQVGTVQPAAEALWRIDPARVYTAGSSLGGLISFRLAFAHPDVYAGAASLSGSFFIGEEDDDVAMTEVVSETGLLPLALYLDHGGTEANGADNLPSNQRLIAALTAAGWTREQSPGCAAAPGQLCTFHAVGATHDELAWRERSWRFLRFLFPVP